MAKQQVTVVEESDFVFESLEEWNIKSGFSEYQVELSEMTVKSTGKKFVAPRITYRKSVYVPREEREARGLKPGEQVYKTSAVKLGPASPASWRAVAEALTKAADAYEARVTSGE